MATELDQTFCGWPHRDLLDKDDSQDAAVAQMLDQGSISFGRFTVDSLAWEKRSVFTHNGCQEELEKLKAPGLVAQKKAYFEAYYKRLRTLKALQADKQAELIEDYGAGDSSTCKHSELEDETIQHETLRNEATHVSPGFLETRVTEAVSGMESSGSLPCRCSDQKSVGSNLDFSTGSTEGNANTLDALLINDLTREAADSSTAIFEEIDTDKNSIDSFQYELHHETSISYDEFWRTDNEDAMLKESCSNALQMGHVAKESTILDSPRRIEEIELLKDLCSDDDAWNLKEDCVAKSSVNDGTAAVVSGVDSPLLKVILPVDNHMTGEAKVKLNKQNTHYLTRRIKESVSCDRRSEKLDCGTKSEATKASQLPKYLLKKTIVQREKKDSLRNVPSSGLSNKNKSTTDRLQKAHSKFMEAGGKKGNTTNMSNLKDDRLPMKSKPASVSSNRPLKGSSINTTAQRQTTILCGFRQSTSVNRHGADSLEASSIEKKREMPKTASRSKNNTAVPRAKDELPQNSGNRSINFAAVKGRCGLKTERPKEGKTEARLRLIKPTPKSAASPPARTRTDLGKQVATRTGRPLFEGKKTKYDLWQEVKPWR